MTDVEDNSRDDEDEISGSTRSSPSSRALSPAPTNVQQQQQFVQEIDYNEIETEEVVGKGSFGVVWKGRWRGRYVAVKHIDTEGERRAFAVEVRQLSRVAHPNIVRLYGACTKNPVCLVMEYAEGGSLYNVLHCQPQARYKASHAMSWALQCACGVAYLHNMKPKPLIHRDLKPPNLLLVLGGRMLKICDFGTACDLNTYMTNNKGSAAWMAPEVFEGSRYTEKCDVFSWGVILWEVLSRRKPFDDIGGSAYRIMWAVHIGQRPPLMEGCPKPIEELIVRCWRKIPEERPSMNEVVRIMTCLSEFFTGHTEPLEYSPASNAKRILNTVEEVDSTMDMDTTMDIESQVFTNGNNVENQSTLITLPPLPEGEDAASSLDDSLPVDNAMKNAPMIQQQYPFEPLHVFCDPDAWTSGDSSESPYEITNMAGLDKMLPKNMKTALYNSTSGHDLDDVYRLLDADLRPVTPDESCQLSQDIFMQHKQLAQEYLKVQTEIALVGQQKTEMLKSLSSDALRHQRELQKLEDEKESLVKLYRNLKRQLEIMTTRAHSAVVLDPNSELIPQPVSGENGWVLVPRQEPSRISQL